MESLGLKTLIEHKDLVIQKTGKGNTVVIADCTKYLQGIKSLFLDRSKFMQLPIDEGKRINYIVNFESKLKDHFKVPKIGGKNSEKEFDNICPVGTTPGILYGNPKVRQVLSAINKTQSSINNSCLICCISIILYTC